MNVLKRLFSQRLFWGGFFILTAIVFLFMVGIMGSIVNPQPNNLPVALVVEDEGIDIPNNSLNFGETVKKTLTENQNTLLKWSILQNKDEAISEMNDKAYYAAIIIPENASQSIASLLQPDPQQPEIEIIINEGMNYTAANTIDQILDEIVFNMNTQIQDIIYNQLETQSLTLAPDEIKQVINALKTDKEIINEVGSNTANGNSPVLFTQILWLSVFICSLLIFIILKKTTNQITLSSIASQLISGILFVLVIVTSMVLFANYVLDVDIPNIKNTFFFLLFSGFVFFLLQNALFNWIGIISTPFILLVFLFSIPILNLPIEFLPTITKDLLYSWIPLKFSVEGLREIFFFDNHNINESLLSMIYIGTGSLVIMILSIFKGKIKNKNKLIKNKESIEISG